MKDDPDVEMDQRMSERRMTAVKSRPRPPRAPTPSYSRSRTPIKDEPKDGDLPPVPSSEENDGGRDGSRSRDDDDHSGGT